MNSMNSKTTIVGLVAAVAVLSGAMGLSVTGAFSDLKVADYTSLGNTGMLIGHVEIEARHSDGELYDYRQTDNAVVDDGEQCILKMLFSTTGKAGDAVPVGRGNYATDDGTNGTTSGCTGALNGAWDVIAIGTGTTAANELDVVLVTESTANGGQRGIATTKTWTNGSGAVTQIVMSKTFTASGGNIGDVTESGLFNSTTANKNGMLARNTFTAVTINSGDSITITWTFVVGDA